GNTCGNVPFVLWGEREGRVSQARRNQGQLISDRSHGANLEGSLIELLPLSPFHFAAAGKNQGAVEAGPSAGPGGLSVVGHTGIQRAQENFVAGWVADASGDRAPILHHRH